MLCFFKQVIVRFNIFIYLFHDTLGAEDDRDWRHPSAGADITGVLMPLPYPFTVSVTIVKVFFTLLKFLK
jgi:hypothetical protein